MSDKKSDLFRHLLHEHDVLLTTSEYAEASLEDLKRLDPCEATA